LENAPRSPIFSKAWGNLPRPAGCPLRQPVLLFVAEADFKIGILARATGLAVVKS
jgi:hypothetical protein